MQDVPQSHSASAKVALVFGVPATSLRIFFHDRCFDGVTSAALFAEFFRSTRDPEAVIDYQGMAHSADDPFEGIPFDAETNACVDFRYCSDPRMHWWFDHHQSAFQPASLEDHFAANPSDTKFYDPKARSCSLFAYRVLTEKLGFALDDPNGYWEDLLEWADRIDGAVFDSAREVVELKAPAFQLMTWLRSNRDGAKMSKTIELLGRRSLEEMVQLPWIAEELPALLRAHHRSVEVIKERLQVKGSVVFYDLSEDDIDAHSGFAAYMHEPEAKYSVGLVHSGRGSSISVGCNPWSEVVGGHNIAAICEQYGGGGHPNVGGIAVPAGQLERARDIVAEVVRKLAD